MRRRVLGSVLAFVLFLVPASARAESLLQGIASVLVDGGNSYDWYRVDLPGAFCGNGSPYKFFIRKTASPNMLFFFEGGGACWDYDTCSGRAGKLGAANPNGIPDDYMKQFTAKYVSPLVNGADPGLPFRSRTDLVTKDWNIVYLPYCTGDVHVGDRKVTYTDPTGQEPPLDVNHNCFWNTHVAVWLTHLLLPNIDNLLVAGFSAGGTAALAAYYVVRTGLSPRKSYLLNDSGPVYSTPGGSGFSLPLHQKIADAWGLATVFSRIPGFDPSDFGSINTLVAQQFPADRLAYTGYSQDYNYSRFSYERFLTPNDRLFVLLYWKADEDRLVSTLKPQGNWSFFIPWERPINDSH